MKKVLAAILVMGIILCSSYASAVGTVTQELFSYKDGNTVAVQVLELDVLAGASGVVTSVPIKQDILDKLVATPFMYWLQTVPSIPNPQAAYDITFTDADGWDLLVTKGANRSASAKEVVAVVSTTSNYSMAIPTGITFNMSGNNVEGARVKVKVFFTR